MARPNATQILAVIKMGREALPGQHGYLAALLSPNSDPEVRADALRHLRQHGGMMARYCDDYEQAAYPQEVVCHG